MSRDPRGVTNHIIRLMDEGLMSPREVALAALNWLSEAEVADMVRANDWDLEFSDGDIDEED